MEHKGFTLWFTGLSGAGKTTIGDMILERLRANGARAEILDGDVVRTNLSVGLGFSKEDRDTNIRRIGFVSELLARNGVICIVAAISPYKAIRDEVRAQHENFVEVFASCELDALIERDVKGLYKMALEGRIENFTGVSDPYEPPIEPEIVFRSDLEAPEESAEKVWNKLIELGVDLPVSGATAKVQCPAYPQMDSEERSKAMEAAYKLLETPRAHLRVRFEQTDEAVLLLYRDDVLTGVALDSSGINAASAMAVALGVDVPPSGKSVEVLASTGLLYRVLAISDLDFSNPASFDLANHLVNEAIDMQRSAKRTGSEGRPMEVSDLESGLGVRPYVIDLSQSESQAYIDATGDDDTLDVFGEHVHPLHLDAFVLSRLIEEIGIVENRIETVHVGQQMTVHKQVWPGDLIVANATLKSCSNRRGSIWAVFETTFTDENGDRVAVSSSTIIVMP